MVKRYEFYHCHNCGLEFLHKEEYDTHIGPCREMVFKLNEELKGIGEKLSIIRNKRFDENKEKIEEAIHIQRRILKMWLDGEISDRDYHNQFRSINEIIDDFTNPIMEVN